MSNVDFSQNGSASSTGFEDAFQAAAGSSGTATANTSSSASWVAHTIALRAAGSGCSNNCWYGIEDGSNTYYGGAIEAAQTEFNNNGRPGVQRVLILVSDGAGNTGHTNPCQTAIDNAEILETPLPDGSTTWVFSIFYGADEDCTADNPNITGACAMHVIAHNYVTDPAGINPGIANEQVVCSNNNSDPAHRFYHQPANGDLTEIFQAIGESLTATRLVSNNAV